MAIFGAGIAQGLAEGLHLFRAVDAEIIQAVADVIDQVGVGLLFQQSGLVEGSEGLLHVLGAVHEVQHEGIFLAGGGTVEAREGLHGLDATELLVHEHGVEQGLVKAGLVFFGHDEDVELSGKMCGQLFFGYPEAVGLLVEALFRIGHSHAIHRVADLAGKGHQGPHAVDAALADLAGELPHVAHGVQA